MSPRSEAKPLLSVETPGWMLAPPCKHTSGPSEEGCRYCEYVDETYEGWFDPWDFA